jgi:DNA-binding NarL/FixJ family response regulator
VTRVLLVDDDDDIRASLRIVIESDPGLVVAAEFADGARAVAAARRLRCDVAVVDLRMPGIDGIETTRLLRQEPDGPAVLVLTAFEHDDSVLRALGAGASGFLLKGSRPHELPAAIHDVAAGRCVLAPAVASAVVERAVAREQEDRPEPVDDLGDLTDRERALVIAVGEGLTNAQIAGRLGVTPTSAKTYVSRILDKLGLQNRTQLAIAAHRAGLV